MLIRNWTTLILLWTRKIPKNERDKNNVHKIIFVFDDFGLQSLSNLILWFDLRKVLICGCAIDPKGRWAWSKDERSSRAVDLILKVDLSGSSRSRWGLILRMSVSSRAFGLDLEERLDVWICRRCWSKGPLGLDLGRTMNEERRRLSWFFGNLDAWELRSFRASELQEFLPNDFFGPLNEWNGLVFIEFSKA